LGQKGFLCFLIVLAFASLVSEATVYENSLQELDEGIEIALEAEQANFLKDIIGLKNVEYRTLDIFEVDRSTVGQFDISFFLGLLYHLNKPIEALARLKDVTAGIAVIDSSWTVSNQPLMVLRSDNVHDQNFSNALCMRPSCSAVYLMLEHVGFKNVRLLEHATNDLPDIYLQGGRGTFLAEA